MLKMVFKFFHFIYRFIVIYAVVLHIHILYSVPLPVRLGAYRSIISPNPALHNMFAKNFKNVGQTSLKIEKNVVQYIFEEYLGYK